MGIIIRVLYNNQDWKAPCTHPGIDSFCHKCFADSNIDIRGPKKNDEVCSGLCWERDLCTNYEWGCTPKGRKFGNRAFPGIKVFFVFQQPDHKYTLWATTQVTHVNVRPIRHLVDHEIGYYHWMRFAPFDPLPKGKWVKDLTDIDLVDRQWKQGRHRFITPAKEKDLEGLIEGTTSKEELSKPDGPFPINDNGSVHIKFSSNIYKKLLEIGKIEGRQLDEILKEAVAEWLRDRNWLIVPDGKA